MGKRVSGIALISFSGFSVRQRCQVVNGLTVELVKSLIE